MANIRAPERIGKGKGDGKRQRKERGNLYVTVQVGRWHSSGVDDERGRGRM